jgi:hypothetical protein
VEEASHFTLYLVILIALEITVEIIAPNYGNAKPEYGKLITAIEICAHTPRDLNSSSQLGLTILGHAQNEGVLSFTPPLVSSLWLFIYRTDLGSGLLAKLVRKIQESTFLSPSDRDRFDQIRGELFKINKYGGCFILLIAFASAAYSFGSLSILLTACGIVGFCSILYPAFRAVHKNPLDQKFSKLERLYARLCQKYTSVERISKDNEFFKRILWWPCLGVFFFADLYTHY